MTVGQELAKMTKLRLFHNHMTIEPVIEIFGYYNSKTVSKLRDVIFQEFATSDHYGLIFTYMWAFDQISDWDYVRHVTEIFKEHDAQIYYVELLASLEVRLLRNVTENRLQHKASKRDIERSSERLLNDDRKYRCVSNEGEIPFNNYLRIDNSSLTPTDTAEIIRAHFNL
ncbi:shikimate kinase [Proteiniclasticum sp.]|uniref:shikimate kinase n=1 Tax=Proteiniclasticum sp. TaxID=2053595 RepID=UPI0028A25EFF|nr:shikimate kinase [Proteiniclasticum sp.]